MKITLENYGEHKVELPDRFEDFLKKMKVEQQITGSEFIFVNDQKQKSKINNTSTYEKMKQQIPKQNNPRLLVAQKSKPIIQRSESSSDDEEENLLAISETDFFEIFYNNAKFIPCQCKFYNIQIQNCPYCNDSKKIPIDGFRGVLNRSFIQYFKENFPILKDYINECYGIKIKSFSEWLVLHKQLVNFDIQEEFLFQCTICRHFYKNQYTVYVKQYEFPQLPICVECFTKLNSEYQKQYKKLVSIKNPDEDIQSLNVPPKLKLI